MTLILFVPKCVVNIIKIRGFTSRVTNSPLPIMGKVRYRVNMDFTVTRVPNKGEWVVGRFVEIAHRRGIGYKWVKTHPRGYKLQDNILTSGHSF